MKQAILVTGASTGIGRAIAVYFAQQGWRVYAGVRREIDAAELQSQQDGILPVHLDVTSAEQIKAVLALVTEYQGLSGLAALVNNAGVAVPAPVELLPIDELRRQFEINVFGVVAVTQEFMPLLRKYGHGATVVNISSTSARMVSPLAGAYSASKMALEAFTSALRFELRPWGIRVVSVQPGPVTTPIWEKTLERSLKMLENLPPERVRSYQPLIDIAVQRANRDPHFPAERVAKVVWNAVLARSPRSHYLVTKNQLGRLILNKIPDQWRDELMARILPKWGG